MKNCPLCGSKLEKGFVNTRDSLLWDTKKHKYRGSGESIIGFGLGIKNLEAYRCTNCELVLFKYGKADTQQFPPTASKTTKA